MLGFGALGEVALGEGGDLRSKFVTSGFSWPMRRATLTAAVVATTVAGFIPPPARAAPVFSSFSQPQPHRYSFADQQTSLLFEVEFVPPAQVGGTSRKLDSAEPVADEPRRKKTGLEPIKKAETQPLIEPPKPALPLPTFESAPEAPLDERSPFDLVDPALIPQNLLGLQAQIFAAQAAYLDEQDARDIADIAALLDNLDEGEA